MKKKWRIGILVTSIAIIAGAYVTLQLWLNAQAKLAVDDVVTRLKPYANVTYQSVSTNMWTGMVYLQGVHVHPMHNASLAITIQKLGIKATSNPQGFITHLKLNVQQITLPVEFADIYPLARQVLYYYPNRQLNGNFFLDYQFNPTRYQMRMIIFTEIEKLGKLEVKLLSAPYHPQFMSAIDFANLPLIKLDIIYHDHSLAAKLWRALGAHEGKTAETFQKEMLQQLDFRLKNITVLSMQRSVMALKQFVAAPTDLRISATSLDPISLHQLNTLPPTMTASRVNVQISSSSSK